MNHLVQFAWRVIHMNRFVIMTVGKTHSGKTTFAKRLENELPNSVVIDQDNHAEFLHAHYQTLIPKTGSNLLKYALTQTVVNYAVNETTCHLILSNSNRNRKGRLNLLEQYRSKGFTTILVHFDIPDQILKDRIAQGKRSTNILRTVSTFEEVLTRQQIETNIDDILSPIEGEADYLFEIKHSEDVQNVIQQIISIAER